MVENAALNPHLRFVGVPESSPWIKGIRDVADQIVEASQEEGMIEIDIDDSDVLREVKQLLTAHFSNLNLEEVMLLPNHVFMAPGTSNKGHGIPFVGATSDDGSILVFEYSPTLETEEYRDWNELLRTSIIAHEMYHATAPTIFAPVWNGVARESSGLNYAKKPGAVEEGLATRFQIEAYTIIARHFRISGNMFQFYRNNLEGFNDRAKDLIYLRGIDEEGGAIPAFLPYKDSYVLVDWLINGGSDLIEILSPQFRAKYEKLFRDFSGIQGMEKLMEGARLKKHTLAFAKKIEGVFGAGSFRELVTSDSTQAEALLGRLLDRLAESKRVVT